MDGLYQIRTVGGQIESLIQGLQGLALAARGGGLDAFAGMCQHFSGQLEPARHAGLLSGDSLQLSAPGSQRGSLFATTLQSGCDG